MKWSAAPEISEEVFRHLASMAVGDASPQQMILSMRTAGLSVIACMKLYQRLYGVSRQEAKTVVHFSEAWSDRRQEFDVLHDAAWDALNELAAEDNERAKTVV